MVVDKKLFEQVLDIAGYMAYPSEKNVREMFSDYVSCGFFSNVDIDDIADISTEEICRAFLNLR